PKTRAYGLNTGFEASLVSRSLLPLAAHRRRTPYPASVAIRRRRRIIHDGPGSGRISSVPPSGPKVRLPLRGGCLERLELQAIAIDLHYPCISCQIASHAQAVGDLGHQAAVGGTRCLPAAVGLRRAPRKQHFHRREAFRNPMCVPALLVRG